MVEVALSDEFNKKNVTFDLNSIVLPEHEYVEIIAIDPIRTTALTKELNKKTEELFTQDDTWFADHPDIGVEAIKAGRLLPPLSKKG